jgi:hypothetical protein
MLLTVPCAIALTNGKTCFIFPASEAGAQRWIAEGQKGQGQDQKQKGVMSKREYSAALKA